GPYYRFSDRARLRRRPADLLGRQRGGRDPEPAGAYRGGGVPPRTAQRGLQLAEAVGSVRRGAAAARLPGVQGGLRRLPQPQVRQLLRARRARLQRGGDQGDRQSMGDRGADGEPGHGREQHPQGAAVRPFPQPLRQRDRRTRRQQQRPSARPVADRRSARGRLQLHLLAADRLPERRDLPQREGRARSAGEPAGAGAAFQSLFRQPQHRHAAADRLGRSGDLCRRHPRERGPDGQGRVRLSALDGGAEPGAAPCRGLGGDDLPDRRDRAGVPRVPQHLGERQARGLDPRPARAGVPAAHARAEGRARDRGL
ncbi:MAG: Ubiquinol-cytochrome C reductase, cytochrome C1 subunit, partial [uncultured Sphingomonas sp.]